MNRKNTWIPDCEHSCFGNSSLLCESEIMVMRLVTLLLNYCLLNCQRFCWQTILKKLYAESLHVLSLSDLRYLRGLGEQRSSDVSTQLSTNADDQAVGSEAQLLTELRSELAAAQWSWNEEKQSLLSSVESLKKLLAQLQVCSSVSHTNCLVLLSVCVCEIILPQTVYPASHCYVLSLWSIYRYLCG